MIFFSLIWSGIYLFVLFLVAGSPARLAFTILTSVVALFATPMCMFFSPAVGFQVLFVFVASVICSLRKAGPRVFRQSIVGASVVGYAAAAILAIGEHRDREKLLEKYSFQSLAPRLAYETDTRFDPAGHGVQASHTLSDRWREIARNQDGAGFSIRRKALEQLHSTTLRSFIASPAFGVGRMTHLAREEWLEQYDDIPVPQVVHAFDGSPEPDSSSSQRRDGEVQPKGGEEFDAESIWPAHERAVADFIAPGRYGIIHTRDEVAGFLAHRLGPNVNLQTGTGLPPPDRLDLVSLLKFSKPRIHLSDNLPRMDELIGAPTRPLDAFEQQALTALENGEDIVSADERSTIRALGAIRALKRCLQCHTVQEGQLLGAFSYRWGAVKPQPPAMPPTRDAT